jgi:hypothetical protein
VSHFRRPIEAERKGGSVLDHDLESRRQFSRERAAQLAENYRRAQRLRPRNQQLARSRKLTSYALSLMRLLRRSATTHAPAFRE